MIGIHHGNITHRSEIESKITRTEVSQASFIFHYFLILLFVELQYNFLIGVINFAHKKVFAIRLPPGSIVGLPAVAYYARDFFPKLRKYLSKLHFS